MILRLKRQHVRLLRQEAQKVHPIEACAMLFGESTQKEAVVKRVVVTPNKLKSSTTFEISPETFIKAFKEAEHEEFDLIGLFHSHPASVAPSSIDLEYMKLWGDVLWLILSSTSGDLAAYILRNGKLRKIPVKIADASG